MLLMMIIIMMNSFWLMVDQEMQWKLFPAEKFAKKISPFDISAKLKPRLK